MAGLNQNFLVKNSINTLASYLSSGVDLSTLFAPYNVLSVLSAIDNTPIGSKIPSTAVFTTLSAKDNTRLDSNLSVGGHVTFEGVTSTGATGTGKIVFDTSPTISAPDITGHPTIEGVTSTGATGTGKIVFDTIPTISAPNITGHPTIEGVTSTGSTGTGNIVFASSPSISSPAVTGGTIDNTAIGNTTRSSGKFTTLDANNAVTLSPSTGTVTINPTSLGSINNVTIGATTPSTVTSTTLSATGNTTLNGTLNVGGHVTLEGVTSTGATGTGNIVFSNSPSLLTPVFTNFSANSGQVGDLYVSGTLYLAGSATTVNQNELVVDAPIIYLANNNPGDTFDIGIAGHNVVNGVYGHTGLLRSHGNGNPGTWYLFSSMTAEPSANNIASASKVIDTLVANTSGTHYGVSTQAAILSSARTIASTSDVNWSVTFDGSQNVSAAATIQPNVVSYSKIQQVGASKVLGNPTSSTANVSEIPASLTGFALLSATSSSTAATTIGLGTTNDVTFNSQTVSNGTQASKTQVFTASSVANASVTVPTFSKTGPYYTIKYVAHIKQTSGANSGARATLEILTTYNALLDTWDGTYYGIIDSTGIFSNVDVSATGSTVDLTFTLVGANNFTVNVVANGITD